MTATAEQLRSDLLALPEADRFELAQLLFESLELPAPEDGEFAFDEELEQRRAEIFSGAAVAVPAEEAARQVRAALASQKRR